MANTGLTGGRFRASDTREGALVVRAASCGGMPPPVFLQKSAEVIENKGREPEKERQKSLRARKRQEVKEIKEVEEVKEQRSASFVRRSSESIGVRRWVRGRQARREILSLGGQSDLASGSPRSGANGAAAALISRLEYGMGVRQDNWSEVRFGCRWLSAERRRMHLIA